MDLAIVTTVAVLWFDVPFRGAFGVLMGVEALWSQHLWLLVLGVGLLAAATIRFRREIV